MSLSKISFSLLILSIVACSASRKSGSDEQTTVKEQSGIDPAKISYLGAPTIVYKTNKDYKNNVPITLSDDGKTIVSYPAPSDVFYNGKLAYPTELTKGYLLDNRGLSPHSVFTKYTYEEYSKLSSAPDANTLLLSIIDKNPITEMYNCGTRSAFKDEVNQLKAIITSNQLGKFKKLK